VKLYSKSKGEGRGIHTALWFHWPNKNVFSDCVWNGCIIIIIIIIINEVLFIVSLSR